MKINLLNAFPGDDPTCKRIPLTQGQAQLVDATDYQHLNQHPWCAQWHTRTETFYAKRNGRKDGKRISILAHREIMRLEHGDPREVHHVNGDTLDNRRENLKVVTRLEQKGLHRNDPRKGASRHGVGVYQQSSGRFRAQARIDGKIHYLGTFDTAEEAQKARADFLSRQERRLRELADERVSRWRLTVGTGDDTLPL